MDVVASADQAFDVQPEAMRAADPAACFLDHFPRRCGFGAFAGLEPAARQRPLTSLLIAVANEKERSGLVDHDRPAAMHMRLAQPPPDETAAVGEAQQRMMKRDWNEVLHFRPVPPVRAAANRDRRGKRNRASFAPLAAADHDGKLIHDRHRGRDERLAEAGRTGRALRPPTSTNGVSIGEQQAPAPANQREPPKWR